MSLCSRSTSVEGSGIDSNSVPLKFEDIVDKKIYDKMRPPKPGGELEFIYIYIIYMCDMMSLSVPFTSYICDNVK